MFDWALRRFYLVCVRFISIQGLFMLAHWNHSSLSDAKRLHVLPTWMNISWESRLSLRLSLISSLVLCFRCVAVWRGDGSLLSPEHTQIQVSFSLPLRLLSPKKKTSFKVSCVAVITATRFLFPTLTSIRFDYLKMSLLFLSFETDDTFTMTFGTSGMTFIFVNPAGNKTCCVTGNCFMTQSVMAVVRATQKKVYRKVHSENVSRFRHKLWKGCWPECGRVAPRESQKNLGLASMLS